MKIAIIVLNYNGLQNTLECIDSIGLQTQKGINLETIVVDNASKDQSTVTLKKIKDIVLIANKNNLGYSGGNNVGIKYALENKADYICVINNDVKLEKDLIINLLKSAKNSIVSPKIYFYPGFEFHKKRYKKSCLGKVIWYAGGFIDWNNVIGIHRGVDEVDQGQYDKTEEVEYATGACIFAKSDVFKKVGLFDERYFLYLEDMDFSLRTKKMGYRIIFEPKAILWHKNAASAGGSGSKIQDYYISRNRLLFAFRYAKPKIKFAVFKQIISQSNDPIKRAALIDFMTRNLGRSTRNL